MADLKVKVGLDKSGFQTGLAAMENSVASFSGKAKGLIAGAFSFGAIGAGLARAIEKGDQLQDLANRFGVAASSLQEVGNAASLSGGSLEDVASAMNKLARNAGEAIGGNEKMQESFSKIGLSVEQLQGMSPQGLFMALSKAVASGALGMQDFAVAQELAGRGAATLMETLRMGTDAILANGQAMGVWSDETIAQLSEASDAIKTFENSMTVAFGHVASFGNGLIETFQTILESTTLMGAAAKSVLTGDFGAAAEQMKRAQMLQIEKRQEQAQSKKAMAVRNVDGGTVGESAAKVKEEEKAAKALEELKAGFRQVERDKRRRQDDEEHREAMRRAEELIDRIEERNQAIKDMPDEDELRRNRLRSENLRRGNAADFDPREALIRSAGLGDTLTSSAVRDPVNNSTVQSISNQVGNMVEKLDELIRTAGRFN